MTDRNQGCIRLRPSSHPRKQTYISSRDFICSVTKQPKSSLKGRGPLIRGIPHVSHCITSRLMRAGMKPATPWPPPFRPRHHHLPSYRALFQPRGNRKRKVVRRLSAHPRVTNYSAMAMRSKVDDEKKGDECHVDVKDEDFQIEGSNFRTSRLQSPPSNHKELRKKRNVCCQRRYPQKIG